MNQDDFLVVVQEQEPGPVIVAEENGTIIVEEDGEAILLTVGIQGPAGVGTLHELADVNDAQRVDGAILMFDATDGKWVAVTEPRNLDLNGGYF